jgi:vanadium nitrogenase delta subunit
MEQQITELYNYVQERCLWQFFSRSWDRKDNIDGIMVQAKKLFAGEEPKADTPDARCHFADAKLMVADFKSRFPWIKESSMAEINTMLDGLADRLTDTVITGSKNRELTDKLY